VTANEVPTVNRDIDLRDRQRNGPSTSVSLPSTLMVGCWSSLIGDGVVIGDRRVGDRLHVQHDRALVICVPPPRCCRRHWRRSAACRREEFGAPVVLQGRKRRVDVGDVPVIVRAANVSLPLTIAPPCATSCRLPCWTASATEKLVAAPASTSDT